ncbi:MAG: hypothetical protein, partial [Olavius algarvensis Gamma 1 endosymbiont]
TQAKKKTKHVEGWLSFKIVQNKKQLLCVTRKNVLLSAGRNTFYFFVFISLFLNFMVGIGEVRHE